MKTIKSFIKPNKFALLFIFTLLALPNLNGVASAEFIQGEEILTDNDRGGYIPVSQMGSWQDLKEEGVESKEDADSSLQAKTSYDADGNLVKLEEWVLPDGTQVARLTGYGENSNVIYCELIYGGVTVRFVGDETEGKDEGSNYGYINNFGEINEGQERFYNYRDNNEEDDSEDHVGIPGNPGERGDDPTLTVAVPKDMLEKLALTPLKNLDPNKLKEMFDTLSKIEDEKERELNKSVAVYYNQVESALIEKKEALESEGVEIRDIIDAMGREGVTEEEKRVLIDNAVRLVREHYQNRKLNEGAQGEVQAIAEFVRFEDALREELEDLHNRIEESYLREAQKTLYPFLEEVAGDPGALVLYRNDKKITSVIKLPAKKK